jgi:hypothetical protein
LSRHIEKRCREEGFPVPALELILAMPGSTLDDFYKEFEVIWNFKAWGSFRHDYMILPDSELSNPDYLKEYDVELVEVYSDLADEDGIDNWEGLYKAQKNYFKTVASCYSFTRKEMIEMWIMNHAGNVLLQEIYPMFEDQCTPPDFGKKCFKIFQKCVGFDSIWNYVSDLYDPTTETKSIKRIYKEQRDSVIKQFIEANKPIIISQLFEEVEGFKNEA